MLQQEEKEEKEEKEEDEKENSTNQQKTIYKINIHDRNYTTWTIFKVIDFKEKELKEICPQKNKLFNNDVFTYNEETHDFSLLHSTSRVTKNIPGVLVLKGSKTYGRHKNGKLLYKCCLDDVRMPTFLIPYEIKHVGFSKVFLNQYVTINFTEWTEKHPIGMLTQLIGPINELNNYYEYQLYCKSLSSSIQKFTKETTNGLAKINHEVFIEKICEKYPSIVDRTDNKEWHIFSIDPVNSLDFDDAFSIKPTINNGTCNNRNNNYLLSIYISNVTIWMDVLNLWDSFSRRISTIYLPDRKRPMLPTILSDCLCSLQSNNTRIAFVLDLVIDGTTFSVVDVLYSNCKIKVFKNYTYEDPNLLQNANYQLLLKVTKKILPKNNVRNSHDLVSNLMILMNNTTAKELMKYNNGIFRSITATNQHVNNIPDGIPENVTSFIKIWNSSAGQYIDLSKIEDGQNISHDLLDMDVYIHITSPIRRLVDLLNIIKFQENTGLIKLSCTSSMFYEQWANEMDYINTTMRSIRKIQNDCSLLHLCSTDPEVMDKLYDGYAFDKINRNDGLYQYIIYLPEIKMVSRVTFRNELENYECKKYKLYLFNDEENFKKKIRLQLHTDILSNK